MQWYSRTLTDVELPNIRLECKVSVKCTTRTTPQLTVKNSHISMSIGSAGIFQDTEMLPSLSGLFVIRQSCRQTQLVSPNI